MNSLSGSNNSDHQLKQFLEAASANQRFQALVHNLTDICWDSCVDHPGTRLETKTQKCMVNCVERFIDTTNFITNRLARAANQQD
ncbi:hypothetical protein HCN44_008369 [Aphidius gifuensis]|uniref:Mitochondrial import inner membrane translocase subunit n=1 Tax=Aphidius gifuensis TaxID=684658 RepID=A0A834XQG8_APHGI|nr:mitochondrial import inner membrane translocase subunit Tim8 A-like [Aphidius gifuensis]KAF7989695.1 hypothetical protein HCN44_008369 [Aphidius gifuensis]